MDGARAANHSWPRIARPNQRLYGRPERQVSRRAWELPSAYSHVCFEAEVRSLTSDADERVPVLAGVF